MGWLSALSERFRSQPGPGQASEHRAALAAWQTGQCDALIGFGGGSAMDTAKAVRALVANPDKTIYDFEGIGKVANVGPFMACISTTSGTAAEVTSNAVITDTRRQFKMSLLDYRIGPVLALLTTAQQQQSGGDLNGASSSLERAQRVAPREPQVLYRLAQVRMAQGEPEEAQKVLDEVAKKTPRNYLRKRLLADAGISTYDRAIEISKPFWR